MIDRYSVIEYRKLKIGILDRVIAALLGVTSRKGLQRALTPFLVIGLQPRFNRKIIVFLRQLS
jgi:hypothetical protein